MHTTSSDSLTFVNAGIAKGEMGTLRIQADKIAGLNQPVRSGDRVIDLHGDRVLPGLINAHDHLQLNNFPRLEYREPYRNANEWIAAVNLWMNADSAFRASVAIARDDRLLLGGIKNILSGVTTVAHHDPLYPRLLCNDFPTRVVEKFGWSHSLVVDEEESVLASYQRTPRDWPWIIHAAEGLDTESADEFERLDRLGCVGANTLIVHGIGLNRAQRARLMRASAGVIWCPSSNLRLFGETMDVTDFRVAGRMALGSDSRLTGARDLLDELHIAAKFAGLAEEALESLATRDNARLLRLTDRGVLRKGSLADILVLPRDLPLSRASRADVRLVMLGGIMRYGDKDYGHIALDSSQWAEVHVDGRPKVLDRRLAALLKTSGISEDGLELSCETWRAA